MMKLTNPKSQPLEEEWAETGQENDAHKTPPHLLIYKNWGAHNTCAWNEYNISSIK